MNEGQVPLVSSCKVCGDFTLDVVSLLCPACALVEFLKNPYEAVG